MVTIVVHGKIQFLVAWLISLVPDKINVNHINGYPTWSDVISLRLDSLLSNKMSPRHINLIYCYILFVPSSLLKLLFVSMLAPFNNPETGFFTAHSFIILLTQARRRIVMLLHPADFSLMCWFIGCFGFNGPLRQYFSLYRAVSQRDGERGEKGQMRVKMAKQPPPAPTASALGPCPTVFRIVGRPGTGSLPSTIALVCFYMPNIRILAKAVIKIFRSQGFYYTKCLCPENGSNSTENLRNRFKR